MPWGRQRRVPGGALRDRSVLTGGLPVARLRTHALDVASRWALGVVATVLPKQRCEVTLVCVADPGANSVEGQRGLRQQLLRTLHPARDHVLVRRLPGGALEQARKVGRAHLRHGGELGQGQLVLQMRQDIGDRAMQRARGETAVERRIEVPADGIAPEEVDRQCVGQGLGIQTTGHVLGFDGGLQDQRHMVQEGIVPGQVWHQLSVVHLERFVGGMHEQCRVHSGSDARLIPLPVDPHQGAGRSRDDVVDGRQEQSRIKVKGQACGLRNPIDRERWGRGEETYIPRRHSRAGSGVGCRRPLRRHGRMRHRLRDRRALHTPRHSAHAIPMERVARRQRRRLGSYRHKPCVGIVFRHHRPLPVGLCPPRPPIFCTTIAQFDYEKHEDDRAGRVIMSERWPHVISCLGLLSPAILAFSPTR